MARIKIAVPGWEYFDGFLGHVKFEKGVSVDHVSEREIKMIGANIMVTKVDSDEQVGPATTMVNARHVSAVVEAALETESEEPKSQEVELKYTEEQLLEIGDKGGIKALREIAKEYGVKGVAISELAANIVEAQKKA